MTYKPGDWVRHAETDEIGEVTKAEIIGLDREWLTVRRSQGNLFCALATEFRAHRQTRDLRLVCIDGQRVQP